LAQAGRLADTLRAAATAQGGPGSALDPAPFKADFDAAMDDDLDSPGALAALERAAADVLSAAQAGRDVHAAQTELRRLGAVFGLRLDSAEPEARVTAGWDQHLQRFSA
jgi:cysteinyl-tRNA synthetase